jgi:hypothetical protein
MSITLASFSKFYMLGKIMTVLRKLSQVWDLLKVLARRAKPAFMPNTIYSRSLPADQNAVDLFRGEWASRLPGDLVAGAGPMFIGDSRPGWLVEQIGSVDGKSLLDLGPLEGGHSYQLERFGADVTGIEGNQLAFLRCLIAKNILGLKAKFLFGDFIRYLETSNSHYDVVFASGVLYHMQDPLKILKLLCSMGDRVYLWTHFYDEAQIESNPSVRRAFRSGVTKEFELDGLTVKGYQQKYTTGLLTYFMPGFCGGMKVYTFWLPLGDIQAALRHFGFRIVGMEIHSSGTPHGPNVSIAAVREGL